MRYAVFGTLNSPMGVVKRKGLFQLVTPWCCRILLSIVELLRLCFTSTCSISSLFITISLSVRVGLKLIFLKQLSSWNRDGNGKKSSHKSLLDCNLFQEQTTITKRKSCLVLLHDSFPHRSFEITVLSFNRYVSRPGEYDDVTRWGHWLWSVIQISFSLRLQCRQIQHTYLLERQDNRQPRSQDHHSVHYSVSELSIVITSFSCFYKLYWLGPYRNVLNNLVQAQS